ncbi:MAG: 1,4-dihydroxy-2-naphthoate polyprenyltransferase, partial [Rhodothermales bacterium]
MSDSSAVQMPSGPALWVMAARPKTLWAAVAPVLLGTAFAVEAGGFHAVAALSALMAAVLIQVGTNFSNDYHDYVKGADTKDRKGPTRVTQAGLIRPEAVRRAAVVTFGLAFAAGLYLIARGGWPILVIGVASILFGVLYTAGRYSLAYLGLADLFVLVFFGPIAVAGTYYVQALDVTPVVVLAGFGPGFLATAILLVNNVRDVDEDRAAGKKTLVVRWGRPAGVALYGGCIAGAALVVLVTALVVENHWPAVAAVGVVPFGARVMRRLRDERDARALNPLLGTTSKLLLVYCIL